jgi:hypothetical protein
MSDAALEKPTLESLAAEVRRLQERLEDMEDLMELRAAVERNAGKPGVPWKKVRTELELDLRQDVLHHLRGLDAGEALVEALEFVGELRVVDA